ncbi:MAG: peroxiredoxin family protein [Actinomycetota bacterium]
MRKILFIIIISMSAILFMTACAGEGQVQQETGSQGYENDFTLLNLEGEEVSLSDFEGKLVVLNFWATWCPPCRIEIPDFIKVYAQYGDKGVQFLGVSNESRDTLVSFVAEYGINYPILIDGSVDTIMPAWEIRAIPTTFILGENGEILEKFEGLLTQEQLENVLDKWL